MRTILILGFIILLSLNVNAEAVEPGETLPPLTVKSRGEIHLTGKDASYTPWSTTQIEAKPHVVLHIAGTMKASKLNEPFQDALNASDLDQSRYGVVSIVDLKQALWGTRGIVNSELVKNKQEHMGSSIVVDKEGLGLESWGLKKKSYAVIILDSSGEIEYIKDGKLTDEEISNTIELLESLIASDADV